MASLKELQAQQLYQARAQERWFPSKRWPEGDIEARVAIELPALLAFALEACKTLDEHDEVTPIKAIPLDELEYLPIYFELLLRNRIVIAPKSRQIMITWATFIYVLWRLLRAPRRKWALVPKKKEDGEQHVEDRLKFTLWAHLPDFLRGQYQIEPVKNMFHVTHFRGVAWRSQLLVYPQGADQLRQYTHSGIIWDEAAHQPKMQDAWKGAAPTIQGRGGKRGQVIVISSAKRGSYMQRLAGKPLQEAIKVARYGEV